MKAKKRYFLSLVLLVGCLPGFSFLATACSEKTAPPTKLISPSPATGLYSSLTPQQVAEKWLGAYVGEDYATDLALLAPETLASFASSPDSFALKARLVTR